MQRKRAGWRKWMAVYACLLWCAGLAAALVSAAFWRQWQNELLATSWAKHLDDAAVDKLGTMRSLMNLRQPGMAAVVRALGSEQASTRTLAYQVLGDEVDHCETTHPDEPTSQRLSDLAFVLSQNVDRLPPAAGRETEKLAMRIAALSQNIPVSQHVSLIDACHHVLSAAKAERHPPQVHRWPLTILPRQRAHTVNEIPPTMRPTPPSMALELAELAAPALARADAPSRQFHAEPKTLTSNEAAALVATREASVQSQAVNQADRVKLAGYTRDTQEEEDEGAIQAARRRAREIDVMELFVQLHEQGPIAAAARMELDARGYSPRQIEVAQHLVSHDAIERLTWAERLPGIRGIDARFWLLRLSHDPNRQVRRAAVGLLATDRDPEVVRRLQQITIAETDDRIRDEAARALEVMQTE